MRRWVSLFAGLPVMGIKQNHGEAAKPTDLFPRNPSYAEIYPIELDKTLTGKLRVRDSVANFREFRRKPFMPGEYCRTLTGKLQVGNSDANIGECRR